VITTTGREGAPRVAGSDLPPGPTPVALRGDVLPKGSAGAVVVGYLAEQVRRLQAADPELRQGDPDAVRQVRLSARRLRTALATFRPVLRRADTEPLRDELAWLRAVLGPARDAAAVRDRLTQVVGSQPGELLLGPVAARTATATGTALRHAHDRMLAELDGPRYVRLLESLDQLLAHPPLTAGAAQDAEKVLPPLMKKAWRRVTRYRGALARAGGPSKDRQLHELRRAARRSRYAAEVIAGGLTGRRQRVARRWTKRMTRVQHALGARQDGLVIRDRLRELGVQAHLDGENGFSYGRLHTLEQDRVDAALTDARRAWARVDRRRLRSWWKA
jgi:CHAD domain-containing protein